MPTFPVLELPSTQLKKIIETTAMAIDSLLLTLSEATTLRVTDHSTTQKTLTEVTDGEATAADVFEELQCWWSTFLQNLTRMVTL